MRAVIFDLDGTLHDRDSTMGRYLLGHLLRLGLPAAQHDAYRERFLHLDERGYVHKRTVFAVLRQEFALEWSVEELFADFSQHAFSDCQPCAGLHQTLAAQRGAGFRLGLVSNGASDKQRRTLAQLGLSNAFDVLVVSEEAGVAKPDEAIYLLAARALGVSPQDCLFVGDHPVNDVLGPLAAGMRPG